MVPRSDGAQGCAEPAAAPFGEVSGDGCRPVSLVYVQEEPWAAAAARIASIAAARQVAVSVSGVKASEVHRGALGSWDVRVAEGWVERRSPVALMRRVQRLPGRYVVGFVLSRPSLRRRARDALRGLGALRSAI